MRHLREGALRRMYDEPLALTAAEQEHFDGCAECRRAYETVAREAASVGALLTTPQYEPSSALAFATLQRRLAAAGRLAPWYQRWWDRNSTRLRPLATPVIAAVLAGGLLGAAGVTAVATHMIRVFEPSRVVAVPVSPSVARNADLRLDYGQVKWLPAPPQAQTVADATAAQQQTGLPVLAPKSLPTGVTGSITYGVISRATGSLTFDAARLNASAAKAGVTVKPMPSNINGSTLIVTGGPALIEAWGVNLNATGEPSGFPTLVIAQTRVPTVDSSGATTQQLEDYLLSQPGVPPDLAAQVKAIKDPTTTLPIPVPQGFATTETVQVSGVQGVLVKAALGAGVVWVKNGVIYAVGGQLTPDQVLAIATSL